MKCAWQSYLSLLPLWLRRQVDMLGKESLQELHLRIGRTPELVMTEKSILLDRFITEDDLNFCVNAASQYSPWSAATISSGFITASGGHRLGICGEVSVSNGRITTITSVTSVVLRVARDFPGIGLQAADIPGSILIVGCPGSGKTTLLRDIIRQKSNFISGSVAVVDERKEIFPTENSLFCFAPGLRTDVLSGCRKSAGIEMVLRTMGPQIIAVDEITAEEDCQAMIRAGWCGVQLLATAHARNREELFTRPVYKPLVQCGLFQNLIVVQPDKTWVLERVVR